MKNHLLIIGVNWPEPNSTAAGSRMLQLIDVFLKHNYQITFISTSLKNEKSFPLEKLHVQTFGIQLNNSSFDELVRDINPDMVLFDRFLTEEQFGWRITKNCPKAMRILDTEDLHFLRKARQQAYKKDELVDMEYLTNDIAKREIASIYRCDLSLIISKFEHSLLVNTFKIDPSILLYLPFMLKNINSIIIDDYPSYSNRRHFISIGNFKHEPNINAILVLKNKVWPLIRKKIPNVELHIYGAYVTVRIKQLHNTQEGFIIKGWVEDKKEAIKKARVLLAPIQFGAGLKGKLIDSMLYGTPSITSKIGAEAMHNNLPWNGFISDEVEEFVNNAIELYNNKKNWLESQQNGITIINQCYSQDIFSKILIDVIDKLQSKLEGHRLQNFIGSMLQHHTLQSTKYLSKWIEEKNSKT